MKTWNVIGTMSGTSLDGLDIAYCIFSYETKWNFTIKAAKTFPYTEQWKTRLQNLHNEDALSLAKAHTEFGHLTGKLCKLFMLETGLCPEFIASHGHTIFHQPENGFTLQIGDGAAIAAKTGLPVTCNFRTLDVAMGGQGAPLVPIGDRILFSDYDFCLNLGGIANISFEKDSQRIAYDICPFNQVFNHYAAKLGHAFDKDGEIARKGNICLELLDKLNNLPYYELSPPKSLGKEWVDAVFLPLADSFNLSIPDTLRTMAIHFAHQIDKALQSGETIHRKAKLLVTGGGAHNGFITKLLRETTNAKIIVPEPLIIDYKEALLFAFLGVLRMEKQSNCLQSVTGATKDNIGGCIYLG